MSVNVLSPETEILTVSQPSFSPAAESLIGLVCDTLNTTPHEGPLHEVMKSMLDIVGQAVYSSDDRSVEFVTFLFDRAAEEYLRKPEPSVSVARLLLGLVIESLAHCIHQRMPIPDCVRGMLPCVQDALEHGDDEHIARTHERMGIVVQGAVYGESVYEQETAICEACGTRFVIADGYYEKDDPGQHIVGYAYCKECCHW